jgi:hypothetical protein
LSETARLLHRGGKVKGFEFAPMNQDVSRRAISQKERAANMIRRRSPFPRARRGRMAKQSGEGAPPRF